jgi:hypothetical protein
MGLATTEEWTKGLDNRGKESRQDSARWEKWEASGGVTRMRMTERQENQTGALQTISVVPMNFSQGPPGANGHTWPLQPVFREY